MNKLNNSLLMELSAQYLALRYQKLSDKNHKIKSFLNRFILFVLDKNPLADARSLSNEIVEEWAAECTKKWSKDWAASIKNEAKRFMLWINEGKIYDHLPRPKVPWETKLKSRFAELIKEFVRRKQAAGFVYRNIDALVHFDHMIAESFPEAVCITKEIAFAWVETASKNGVSVNTAIRRITPIRQLSKYICVKDKVSYVLPPEIPGKYVRYVGYIITDEDVAAFIAEADALEYHWVCPFRHMTAPTVFRLMITTGMRGSEVPNLKRDDVDLRTGKSYIRESKAHALRIIIVHPQMLDVLRGYDEEIDDKVPNREWFFVNGREGTKLCHNQIGTWFRLIWDIMLRAKNKEMTEPQATARDLRHYFATTVAKNWFAKGLNLEALEPYLVCYMGHENFDMTSYYLSEVYQTLPEFSKINQASSKGIYPDGLSFELADDEVPYDA